MSHSDVAHVALNAEGSRAQAVAAHFDVCIKTAYALIARARDAGHPIPEALKGPKLGTSVYDFEKIAEIANRAHGHGRISEAVAAYLSIDRRRASSLISVARRRGYQIPYDVKLADSTIYTKPTVDRQTMIEVACAAEGSQSAAVAAYFGIDKRRALKLICRARERGAPIPYEVPNYKPPQRRLTSANVGGAPVENMARYSGYELVCSCGWSCGVLDGAQTLATHTHTVHKRRPTDVERTPSKIRKKAA